VADEHFFLKDEQTGRRSVVILSFNSINPPVIDLNDRDTSYGISRQTRHHEELSATIDCSGRFESWQRSRIIMVDAGILKTSRDRRMDFKDEKEPNENCHG